MMDPNKSLEFLWEEDGGTFWNKPVFPVGNMNENFSESAVTVLLLFAFYSPSPNMYLVTLAFC